MASMKNFGDFLRQMDPRPPYVEDPGKRSIVKGIFGILVLPMFFIYLILNISSVHTPIEYSCVCATTSAPTQKNQWLFDVTTSAYYIEVPGSFYNYTSPWNNKTYQRQHYGISYFTRKVYFPFYPHNDTVPAHPAVIFLKKMQEEDPFLRDWTKQDRMRFFADYTQNDPGRQYWQYFRQMSKNASDYLKQHSDSVFEDIQVTSHVLRCPNSQCDAKCENVSKIWAGHGRFPYTSLLRYWGNLNSVHSNADFPSFGLFATQDAVFVKSIQHCPHTVARACAISVTAMLPDWTSDYSQYPDIHPGAELCTYPSFGSLLGILGAGLGLVMGAFVNAPAGMRFVFQATTQPSKVGNKRQFFKGMAYSLLGGAYIPLLWSEFSGRVSMKMERVGVRFVFMLVSLVLCITCFLLDKAVWWLITLVFLLCDLMFRVHLQSWGRAVFRKRRQEGLPITQPKSLILGLVLGPLLLPWALYHYCYSHWFAHEHVPVESDSGAAGDTGSGKRRCQHIMCRGMLRSAVFAGVLWDILLPAWILTVLNPGPHFRAFWKPDTPITSIVTSSPLYMFNAQGFLFRVFGGYFPYFLPLMVYLLINILFVPLIPAFMEVVHGSTSQISNQPSAAPNKSSLIGLFTGAGVCWIGYTLGVFSLIRVIAMGNTEYSKCLDTSTPEDRYRCEDLYGTREELIHQVDVPIFHLKFVEWILVYVSSVGLFALEYRYRQFLREKMLRRIILYLPLLAGYLFYVLTSLLMFGVEWIPLSTFLSWNAYSFDGDVVPIANKMCVYALLANSVQFVPPIWVTHAFATVRETHVQKKARADMEEKRKAGEMDPQGNIEIELVEEGSKI